MSQKQTLKLSDLKEKAKLWLLNNQDATGGWAESRGRSASVLNTAEVMVALLDAGVAPGHVLIKKAATFLLGQAMTTGADAGCWPRSIDEPGKTTKRQVPDTVRTCFVVTALIKAAEPPDTGAVKNGLDWLLAIQNNSGADRGWGYGRGMSSELWPTCLAILSMVHASNAGVPNLQKPVEEALGFLVNKWRNADGSFGTGVTQGVHTIYSALALQGAQQAHFQLPGKDYDAEALSWLRLNPREARTMVEEYVRIDPQPNGPANYQYTFVTDALLVRVLTASSVQEHRQSKFASEALISLGEDFDDASGGFYGRHVFSWATAWALKALQEAEQVYPEVPEPKPDPPGARIGTYVLLLAIIELAVTVYLIYTHQLSALIISFLIVLMFATLLAFGLIGEKTFSGIAEKIFGGSNK